MIDVVIPYFDDAERLTSILCALDAQTDPNTGMPLKDVHVIVADDASSNPPDLSSSRHCAHVVRLDEQGYHAATARNRGASRGSGEVIVFLDGDTVPTPNYVWHLTRPIVEGVAALTTGRRRHADFDGLSADQVAGFVAIPDSTRILSEPTWLDEGLERTDSLRAGTPDVYQYVISAVLAVSRAAFESVGGFDERFDSYGGEDWEFASRCWNDGWDFSHVRDAVAFHDGPDVEGRASDPLVKTVESLRISDLVATSATRLVGVRYSVPDVDISVLLRAGDLRANSIAVISILASGIAALRVRLVGDSADVTLLNDLLGDERVECVPSAAHRWARCHLIMSGPLEVAPSALSTLCSDLGTGSVGHRRVVIGEVALTAWSVRAEAARRRRGSPPAEFEDVPASDVGVQRIGDGDLASWCRSRGQIGKP